MLALRLFEVLFLGFVCGLIPGPVVSALFAETLRNGWRASRRIVAWAAAGELVMSIVCVAALSTVSPKSGIFAALSLAGALLLLRLAWDLAQVERIVENGDAAPPSAAPTSSPPAPTEVLFTNRRVFTLAILNGMAWIFWITVCVPQAVDLGNQITGGQWLFIFLFELGWVISTLGLCLVFAFLRPWVKKKEQLHRLYQGVALLFVLFALRLAWGAWNIWSA